MDCDAVRQRLHEWVDEELAPEVRADVDRHLEGCSECAEQAESARRTKLVVLRHASDDQPDPSLKPRIERALAAENERLQASDRNSGAPRPALRLLLFVGVLVAVVLGLGTLPNESAIAHGVLVEESLDRHARVLSNMDEADYPCGSVSVAAGVVREHLGLDASPDAVLSRFRIKGYSIVECEMASGVIEAVEYFCEFEDRPLSIIVYAVQSNDIAWESFHFSSERGYTVVTWADAQCVMAIVSEIERSTLEAALMRP